MKYSPANIVQVYYQPHHKKILVGRLALKSRKLLFEYDPQFIRLNLHLSPFNLPVKPGVIVSDDVTFNGLFGVFNDSLPDGWGRLLLDRALTKHHINPQTLSVLDRLCFVGSHGMGALLYEPESETMPAHKHTSLDEIAKEIAEFQQHDEDRFVEDLLQLGGSSAGARPKVLMHLDHDHWIIKFPSNTDPKDMGAIEYAYHLMAKEAGLDVPEAKLFPSRHGVGFFGCKRFDKTDTTRTHMHTLSGLVHADHRSPSLDYELIMKVTMHLTRNVQECKKLFRQCVFNVVSHNRDDHAKNFSFLMSLEGSWRLSPSYDLTFSSGPNGEHCTMIMGEGKNPGLSHLLKLASIGDIKKEEAQNIIEDVLSVVSRWKEFAKETSVSKASTSCKTLDLI